MTGRTGAPPCGERAEHDDYAGSGYDIGHMASENDFTLSAEAMKAAFVLSNAVPQNPGLNQGKWARPEAAVHDLAAAHGTARIFSGPVFVGRGAAKTIGPDRMAVPTHRTPYKVVLCVHQDGEKEMFGFVMPNIDKPSGTIDDYTVTRWRS